MSLFAELKRRNVFRVGAAYLALGWIVTAPDQLLAIPFDIKVPG